MNALLKRGVELASSYAKIPRRSRDSAALSAAAAADSPPAPGVESVKSERSLMGRTLFIDLLPLRQPSLRFFCPEKRTPGLGVHT